MPVTQCAKCGVTFTHKPSAQRRYCSKRCANSRPHGTVAERFWARVEQASGCWWWTGGLSGGRYGSMWNGGKRDGAHRVAWELANGRAVPHGMVVRHLCDRPRCVRPDHLFLGMDRDNAAERDSRGRTSRLFGEQNAATKVSANQVREMRARWTAGGVSVRTLASQYGLSKSTVHSLVTGQHWRDV